MIQCKKWLVVFFVCMTCAVYAKESELVIQNDFIRCVVNNQDEDTGRFAIESVQGSLQPLIFGRPIPWTSYTTAYIDGNPILVGGVNKKIAKRMGSLFEYGRVVRQFKTADGGIQTDTQMGSILVSQKIIIIKNPYSGLRDVALIQYDITNQDNVVHQVGLRVMADTKLGSNDGAPFRIGRQAVESEMQFLGSAVQDFWQAFDTLVSPNVIAQGILSLPDQGVYPPQRVVLANWGTLADYPWECPYEEGRSFVRAGEDEKDTALALWWNPVPLGPSQTRTIKTLYGVGGLTLSKGALSLGIVAPSDVYATSQKDTLVVGYVSNTAAYDAKEVVATWGVPEGFDVTEGSLVASFNTMTPQRTRQLSIKIKPNGKAFGKRYLSLDVTSSTFDSHNISRPINILGAPDLKVSMDTLKQVDISHTDYFDVRVMVQNKGVLPIDTVAVELKTDKVSRIPVFESPVKQIFRLQPSEKKECHWKVQIQRYSQKDTTLTAVVSSLVTYPVSVSRNVGILPIEGDITLNMNVPNVSQGGPFYVSPMALYIDPSSDLNWVVSWDPEYVRYNRFTPDDWMVSQQDNRQEGLDNMVFKQYVLSRGAVKKRFGKLRFEAIKAGNTTICLKYGDKLILLPFNITSSSNEESAQ